MPTLAPPAPTPAPAPVPPAPTPAPPVRASSSSSVSRSAAGGPAVRLSGGRAPARPPVAIGPRGASTAPAAGGAPASAGPAVRIADAKAARDPRFQKVLDKLEKSSAKAKQHPPASKKATEAQAAAQPPANEKLAGAQAGQVDTMKNAETKKPESSSFLEMLRAEIQKVMPKKVEDGKDFMKGNDKQQLKGAMTGNVNQQKEAATGGIKAASDQAPDPSKVPGKEVTPLPSEPAPAQPPPIGAADAMPAPQPDADVSLQQGKQDSDKAMADAKVTTPQLQEANDPRFTAVVTAKAAADKHADSAPQKYRADEQKSIAQAAAKAVTDEKQSLAAFQGQQGRSAAAVKARQLTAKEKDEAERKKVTDHIQGIFEKTKATVDKKLESLEGDVSKMFDAGADAAVARMRDYIDERFDDRYSGISGGILWLKDKLLPLPAKVKVWFDEANQVFLQELDALVVRVAGVVEARLKEAKDEIARGQKEISDYVQGLPANLKAVGKAAEQEMKGRFDELRAGVDEKKNDLAQKFAQRYKEAYDKGAAALKEMKDAHKSLYEKVKEALAEIIEILRHFKERVMSMFKKGMETIELIVAHPIRFLKNLLSAIKQGLSQFVANIWTHLKAGFMKWLFGSLADAGIAIPADFSLGSILKLVLQVLGLTYARIRAKAVKLIGERNVMLLEKAWELISALITGGPAALWEKIKEFLGDLKAMLLDAIQEWIVTSVIKAAVTKLATMFNPVGAIIQAIITIYNTVMFFIERINQILDFVEAIINSVHKIATGDIGSAANWVEQALARTIPIIIGFLARLLGLSGITDKIVGFIKKIQSKVDQAIDKVIGKIVAGIGKLFGQRGGGATGDPEHASKVTAGLAAIDQEDARYKKDGKIVREDAEKVATTVKRDHPVFKSIAVIDGGDRWNYKYSASPDETKVGEPKKEGGELGLAKGAFGTHLFKREELEVVLTLGKTATLDRIGKWKKDGVLFTLASARSDVGTLYSFDSSKAGQRETSPGNRQKYGYQNPPKDSSIGLTILSKGLRPDSPAPLEPTSATYHKMKARYFSTRPSSGFTNFPYVDAILGHGAMGASEHWNRIGHKQTKADNQTWNRDPNNYRGPEHRIESAASGAESERYLVPHKAIGSNDEWL